MEARCKFCGETKPVEEFNKKLSDGPREPWNLRRCKACTHLAYEERYAVKPNRAAMNNASRNWKANNKVKHAENARRWRAQNPHKVRAINRLNYAIRKGRVVRQLCAVCNSVAQAHHDSYEIGEELNVRWLCQSHHKMWHMVIDDPHFNPDMRDERFGHFISSFKTN